MKKPKYDILHILGTDPGMQEFARLFLLKNELENYPKSITALWRRYTNLWHLTIGIFCLSILCLLVLIFSDHTAENMTRAHKFLIGGMIGGVFFCYVSLPIKELRTIVNKFKYQADIIQGFVLDDTDRALSLFERFKQKSKKCASNALYPLQGHNIGYKIQGLEQAGEILRELSVIEEPLGIFAESLKKQIEGHVVQMSAEGSERITKR